MLQWLLLDYSLSVPNLDVKTVHVNVILLDNLEIGFDLRYPFLAELSRERLRSTKGKKIW